MKSLELQFYDNYVFDSNNHKLLKLPDVLLELVMKKFSTEFNIHFSTINRVQDTGSDTLNLHDDPENIKKQFNLIDQIDMLINYKILTEKII